MFVAPSAACDAGGRGIRFQDMKPLLSFALPVLLWLVVGAVASLGMSLTVGTRGYFFGLAPGLLIGAILAGVARWVRDDSAAYLLSAVIGSLGFFFCVGTLGSPLPVDWEAPWGSVRLPAYVALAGGLLGLSTVQLAKRAGLRQSRPPEPVPAGEESG